MTTVPGAYPEASQATSALIFSILGLICCGPLAIVGFIQARNEIGAIGAGRRDPANLGTANAARIIAIIVGILWIIGVVITGFLMATGMWFGMREGGLGF